MREIVSVTPTMFCRVVVHFRDGRAEWYRGDRYATRPETTAEEWAAEVFFAPEAEEIVQKLHALAPEGVAFCSPSPVYNRAAVRPPRKRGQRAEVGLAGRGSLTLERVKRGRYRVSDGCGWAFEGAWDEVAEEVEWYRRRPRGASR